MKPFIDSENTDRKKLSIFLMYIQCIFPHFSFCPVNFLNELNSYAQNTLQAQGTFHMKVIMIHNQWPWTDIYVPGRLTGLKRPVKQFIQNLV